MTWKMNSNLDKNSMDFLRMKMKNGYKLEVLFALKKEDRFVSGEELCKELNISRTTVWKIIRELREEGYQIEAVTNKGYHLIDSPDQVTEKEILPCLSTRWLGRQIVYLSSTPSTNTKAKELAEEDESHGLLVITDDQTSGKGRRGRSWCGKPAEAIAMSFVLKPKLPPKQMSMLTLVAALAVSRAIEEVTGLENDIKWPNDIVIQGRKICGILTEMSTQEDYVNHVVVGIGINVHTREFPDEIANLAGSLDLYTEKPVVRASLVAKILDEFEKLYEEFEQVGNLSFMKEEYESRLVTRGENDQVRIIRNQTEERIGNARGINDEGELVVCWEDGQMEPVMSGEVSVRGLVAYATHL